MCFCLGFLATSDVFAKIDVGAAAVKNTLTNAVSSSVKNDVSVLASSQNLNTNIVESTKAYNFSITCPSNFPNKDSNAVSTEQCYKVCTAGHAGGRGPKIHNKKISCAPGEYLPYEKDECKKCTFAASQNIVCTGVTDAYPDCTQNQGTKKCEGDEKPNADRTDCVNPNGTQSAKIQVSAGQYLPANKETPTDCLNGNKYCPGGSFSKSSIDQGIFSCDPPATVSDKKDSCLMAISKQLLQYGPNGSSSDPFEKQCWMKKDIDKYKQCVLGE